MRYFFLLSYGNQLSASDAVESVLGNRLAFPGCYAESIYDQCRVIPGDVLFEIIDHIIGQPGGILLVKHDLYICKRVILFDFRADSKYPGQILEFRNSVFLAVNDSHKKTVYI